MMAGRRKDGGGEGKGGEEDEKCGRRVIIRIKIFKLAENRPVRWEREIGEGKKRSFEGDDKRGK